MDTMQVEITEEDIFRIDESTKALKAEEAENARLAVECFNTVAGLFFAAFFALTIASAGRL
jgi:hypothetical protein